MATNPKRMSKRVMAGLRLQAPAEDNRQGGEITVLVLPVRNCSPFLDKSTWYRRRVLPRLRN